MGILQPADSYQEIYHKETDSVFWTITEADVSARKWAIRFQKNRNFSTVAGN